MSQVLNLSRTLNLILFITFYVVSDWYPRCILSQLRMLFSVGILEILDCIQQSLPLFFLFFIKFY